MDSGGEFSCICLTTYEYACTFYGQELFSFLFSPLSVSPTSTGSHDVVDI